MGSTIASMGRQEVRLKYLKVFAVRRDGRERQVAYYRRAGYLRRLLTPDGIPVDPTQYDRGVLLAAWQAAHDAYSAAENEAVTTAKARKRAALVSKRAAKPRRNEAIKPYSDLRKSGVYILLRDGKVSYVGTSKNMRQRVADHRTNGRQFDTAYFIPASEDGRRELEIALIRSLATLENKTLKGATKPKRLFIGPFRRNVSRT